MSDQSTSELAKRIAEAAYQWMSIEGREGLENVISTSGLADLEARLAAAEKDRTDFMGEAISLATETAELQFKLAAAEREVDEAGGTLAANGAPGQCLEEQIDNVLDLRGVCHVCKGNDAAQTYRDLQREVERLDKLVIELGTESTRLKADNERLRDAVGPFVWWINQLDAVHKSPIRDGRAPAFMTYAQYDNLRTALAQPESPQPDEAESKGRQPSTTPDVS